jgi:2-polyprenyl-6-methoxyphenol hydroxylase-like FAD-dependent oxidoreductase
MTPGAADILVVGAGPVGLTMAAELARHGVACRIVEKLAAPSPYCRALGVTPRTLEVWDDMGIARDMMDAGLWLDGMRIVVDGQVLVDGDAAPVDAPYAFLGLPQYETERVLAAHLARFGIDVERGVTVTALVPRDDAVTVTLEHAGGMREEAAFRWVVGCDGAHSVVRHAAGIAFDGDAFPGAFMLGDVRIDWDVPRGRASLTIHPLPDAPPDMFVAIPLPEPQRYRVSTLAPPSADAGGPDHGIQSSRPGPTLADLQAIADRLVGGGCVLSDLRWSSIFRISMRLASSYRAGRLFLAGDAAHIHPPTGGQGMNTGIQDAYNLAWKLALVVRGVASPALLDGYDAERRPVGAAVVAATRAASESIGSRVGDRLADSQLLVAYRDSAWVGDDADPSAAGPRAGERAPDATGLRRHDVRFPLRLHDVLRGPEHVLLVVAPADGDAAADALASLALDADGIPLRRVAITGIVAPERYGVTVLHDAKGSVASRWGAGAWLVRPDGYVGWRGPTPAHPGLRAYFDRIVGRA